MNISTKSYLFYYFTTCIRVVTQWTINENVCFWRPLLNLNSNNGLLDTSGYMCKFVSILVHLCFTLKGNVAKWWALKKNQIRAQWLRYPLLLQRSQIDSQSLHTGLQSSITLVQRDPRPSSDFCSTRHEYRTHT